MSPANPNLSLLHVPVELGERRYDIHIGSGLFEQCADIIAQHTQGARVLIISDSNVASHYSQILVDHLHSAKIDASSISFPAGEPNKSLEQAERLWQACAEHKIDRSSTLIALGGGVTGDLCGFVASAWMRGIRFIQIPTSLLAMVDSSVGGKTGINSKAGKNLIGAFKQPAAVIIDPTLLSSMEQREYAAGLAEVLKYGIIYDPDFLSWQEQHANQLHNRDPAALSHAVAESCRIKAHYVVNDEHEHGIRAHLNYGHTFGHALEKQTAYQAYLHGEAVGIGMRMAARFSELLGLLEDKSIIERQDALLQAFQLPLQHPCADPQALSQELCNLCALDKKVSKGKTRFIVPIKPGHIELVENPDPEIVRAAFASCLESA